MQTRTNIFTTIKTEGMLLPTDLLQRIASGSSGLDGLNPTDYHLAEGEQLRDAISRSWYRLLGVWKTFSKSAEQTPPTDLGIGMTRSRWLLPLFQELGYGTLQRSKVTVIEGKEYPISHLHDPAAIHLVGFGIDLDKRTAGAAGAARVSPHGLVQEFLNRSEPHLWGIVSNGYRLRILRDNVSLTRQAFVEFDLKSMMDGEVYSDFVLLWMLCHQSRLETEEGKTPDHCWLEKWSKAAQEQGTRALEDLRNGVENAIKALGSGFLACKSNTALIDKLKSGDLNKQDYYRHLLRIVYRLIFLFTAEDRDLLLLPEADEEAKNLYTRHYSTQRLRRLAQKTSGTRHCDLYRSLCLVFEKLDHEGCKELGLPALGSFLWSRDAIGDLAECDTSNRSILDCIRALAFTVAAHLDSLSDDDIDSLEKKRRIYDQLIGSAGYESGHLLADLWCAAFVIKKDKDLDYAITETIFRDAEKNPHSLADWLKEEVKRLAKEYQYFHWYLEFPSVFWVPAENEQPENEHTGLCGGFDCVLGNPPWEHTELKEKEWFSERQPDIANAPTGAKRKEMIEALRNQDPQLWRQFTGAVRQHAAVSRFFGNCGAYPFCGRGRINTYALFAEANHNLINIRGRAGFIVQSDIATSDTYKKFFTDLLCKRRLVSFHDFVNMECLFPHIHRTHPHFCLITLAGVTGSVSADFTFWNTNTGHLNEPERHISLRAEDLELLNPNTRTCPIFRSKADAELTKAIYHHVPVLIKEACDRYPEGNPWGISFKQGLFNMTSDSHLFHTREELEEQGFDSQTKR